MRRKPVPDKVSKKRFTKGALNVHPKNTQPRPQRGGLRL